MALEPRTVQCMPARLSRVAMTTLHPASTTPVEVHKALGVELWVAHAVSIGLEIVETAASFLGARNLAPNPGEQNPEFSVVEFFLGGRPDGCSTVHLDNFLRFQLKQGQV